MHMVEDTYISKHRVFVSLLPFVPKTLDTISLWHRDPAVLTLGSPFIMAPPLVDADPNRGSIMTPQCVLVHSDPPRQKPEVWPLTRHLATPLMPWLRPLTTQTCPSWNIALERHLKTHTRTHTHKHTRRHADTQTHRHACAHTHTDTHTRTHTHTHATIWRHSYNSEPQRQNIPGFSEAHHLINLTSTLTIWKAHRHAHTHTHSRTHTHSLSLSNSLSHTHTHTHSYTQHILAH